MAALGWLLNLGFAAGGVVVSVIRRLVKGRNHELVTLGTSFASKDEELCTRGDELVRMH